MPTLDLWSMLFVFMLATFIGLGVIQSVSRLLHTPLMSLTNAISAIAVVGSILVTGATTRVDITRSSAPSRSFASMTNIVSGFLITDRMLKMFKTGSEAGAERTASHDPRPRPARLPRRVGAVHLRAALDEHAGTARRGVYAGVAGMALADRRHAGPAGGRRITAGSSLAIVAGIVVGVPLSRVPLTAVPQRTALSHAFGGLAAGLVGTAKYYLWLGEGRRTSRRSAWSRSSLEIILGFLTFTGSLMAAGKLQEVKWIPQRPVTYPIQNVDQPRAARRWPSARRRCWRSSDRRLVRRSVPVIIVLVARCSACC